jgi:hypothetical protein
MSTGSYVPTKRHLTRSAEKSPRPAELERAAAERKPDAEATTMNRKRQAAWSQGLILDAVFAILFASVLVLLAKLLWRMGELCRAGASAITSVVGIAEAGQSSHRRGGDPAEWCARVSCRCGKPGKRYGGMT